jgi:hypothetical protein
MLLFFGNTVNLIETCIWIKILFFKDKYGNFIYQEYNNKYSKELHRNQFIYAKGYEDLKLAVYSYIFFTTLINLFNSYIPILNILSLLNLLCNYNRKIKNGLFAFTAAIDRIYIKNNL